jgi:hypothetical protein
VCVVFVVLNVVLQPMIFFSNPSSHPSRQSRNLLSYLPSGNVLLDNGICSALDPCTIKTTACHSLKSFPVRKEA